MKSINTVNRCTKTTKFASIIRVTKPKCKTERERFETKRAKKNTSKFGPIILKTCLIFTSPQCEKFNFVSLRLWHAVLKWVIFQLKLNSILFQLLFIRSQIIRPWPSYNPLSIIVPKLWFLFYVDLNMKSACSGIFKGEVRKLISYVCHVRSKYYRSPRKTNYNKKP